MKYFVDTEFIEGIQERPLVLKSRLGHWMIGKPKPTVDLVSIGIVSEDGREYYAVSKDFNLKEAWNRYDTVMGIPGTPSHRKLYWLRENVLKVIFMDFLVLEREYLDKQKRMVGYAPCIDSEFSYSNFKRLLKRYGKTNKEIGKEVVEFCGPNPKFYGYYADYDWVVFCWLFGKMINLPEGFPMYCYDLKQELDRLQERKMILNGHKVRKNFPYFSTLDLKKEPNYPKPSNEHHALSDAHWNKKLYEFLRKGDQLEKE